MRVTLDSVSKKRSGWTVRVRGTFTLADPEDGPDLYRCAGQVVDMRIIPVPSADHPVDPKELRARLFPQKDKDAEPSPKPNGI